MAIYRTEQTRPIMSSKVLSTVEGIKKDLSKLLPVESIDSDSVESIKDMFGQLEQCNITLDVLTKTLIGTIVSKFKPHDELGPTAKTLVKKWKKVAKQHTASSDATSSSSAGKAVKRDSLSTSTLETALEEEWAELQPARQTTCKKLHASLTAAAKSVLIKQGINKSAVDHLTVTRATEIESAIHDKNSLHTAKQAYLDKARSLCFNIKKNQQLACQIVLGQMEPSQLVTLSAEQLASEENKKEMMARTQKLMDTKRLDWEQANESKINEMCGIKGDLLSASLLTCDRCKITKTTSTQKQTRSADEPMTVFVLCLNCGKRWKC